MLYHYIMISPMFLAGFYKLTMIVFVVIAATTVVVTIVRAMRGYPNYPHYCCYSTIPGRIKVTECLDKAYRQVLHQ